MFAFGLIGFLAGLFFYKHRYQKPMLYLYGGVSTLVLYGGIMNISTVLLTQAVVTKSLIVSTLLAGVLFDAIHAAATVIFLMLLSTPLFRKLQRVITKYGLSYGP